MSRCHCFFANLNVGVNVAVPPPVRVRRPLEFLKALKADAFECRLRAAPSTPASPFAADGFSCTPAGSVTVVSRTSASARPSGFASSSRVLRQRARPRSAPSGVLRRLCASGAHLDRRGERQLAAAFEAQRFAERRSTTHTAAVETKLPGCVHESASTEEAQRFARGVRRRTSVGSVRNGVCGRLVEVGHGLSRLSACA